MDVFYYLFSTTVSLAIHVIQFLMLIRAVLSFLPVDEEGKLTALVYTFTEPVVLPVRRIFERFGWFASFPLDIPFFVTYLLLSFLLILL